MRRFYLSAFFLFFVFLTFSQTKKEKKNIRTYAVKSVTENVTEILNGKEVVRKDAYTLYDKNANIILNEEYRKDGSLKHKETAKYDSKGNKLEETSWDAAETQPNPEKYIKHVSKFDSDDNKMEELQYDANGKLVGRNQYSYNTKGDKVLEVSYEASGKLVKKTVYSYNSKGLKVEKKEYDASNTLISDRKYMYEF